MIPSLCKFGWLRLYGCSTNALSQRAAIEKALHEDILPPDPNDLSRTERLLSVVASFDDKGYKAFISLLARRPSWTENLRLLVDLSSQYNVGFYVFIGNARLAIDEMTSIDAGRHHGSGRRAGYEKSSRDTDVSCRFVGFIAKPAFAFLRFSFLRSNPGSEENACKS